MKYSYKTEFGTFTIVPDIDNGYSLLIEPIDSDKLKLGWYASASMAADDMFAGITGFSPWDEYANTNDIEEPYDISQWIEELE